MSVVGCRLVREVRMSEMPSEMPSDIPHPHSHAVSPDRPSLRVHKADGNGPDHGTWVLVPPVCAGGEDPYDALRRDCAAVADAVSPSRALLHAVLHTVRRHRHRPTFEHLAVGLLDALHVATSPLPPSRDDVPPPHGLDDWLRPRLVDLADPTDVVAGVLAAAESAHCQTTACAEATSALLAVTLVTEVFCRGDEQFPWSRLHHEMGALCGDTGIVGASVLPSLRAVVTAHWRRDDAVRALDSGDGRSAARHAAAARAAFRTVGCVVDAAGCDVLEAVGLLGPGDDGAAGSAARSAPGRFARVTAVARLERARSLFAEFAFDGHAAHCAIVLGAVALDDGRYDDAFVLGRAGYDGSRRAGAPVRQVALAAELCGDALTGSGEVGGATRWYRTAAAATRNMSGDAVTPQGVDGSSGGSRGAVRRTQADHEAVDERGGEADG
jgi:hypothetical protein